MADADVRVGRLAAGQHSLVTTHQLLKAGLTTPQIDHRVQRSALGVVFPGVYRVPGVRPTWLFGLRGFERCPVIEISVEDHRAPRLPGVPALVRFLGRRSPRREAARRRVDCGARHLARAC